MKQFNKIILVLLFGFAVLAQSVQAQNIPDVPRDTRNSASIVISPYVQAVPNDSYAFIGISHPSLDTAVTQIGVALEVIDMTTTVNSHAGRSAIFTVGAGETHRVFVVPQNHATINSSNSAFTDSRTHLIPTVSSAQFGQIRVTSVSQRPENSFATRNMPNKSSWAGSGKKWDNLAQLSMWCVIYVESAVTGFAMEFIGDMQDSTSGGDKCTMTTSHVCSGAGGLGVTEGSTLGGRYGTSWDGKNEIPRQGRGIN